MLIKNSLLNCPRKLNRILAGGIAALKVEPVLGRRTQSGRLVRRPRQDVALLEDGPAGPGSVCIEPVGQVLQAGRALKDDDLFLGHWVLVLEGGDHALRVDGVEPLVASVDDGENVRELQLLGED